MSGTRTIPPPPGAADVLSLNIGNHNWVGWQRIAVTRSMDTVPASFDLQVTEHYPDTADLVAKPGDPCQIKIGGDLVLTGYVDRYSAIVSAHDHTVRIIGRSKSADLVDCSAIPPGGANNPTMVSSGTALSIIQQLAEPYGVTVNSIAGPGRQINQFQINLGETAWERIDWATRISHLVAYDMPDGSIVLAEAGKEQMASGFSQGVNIEQAAVNYSMDERFSEYEGHFLSTMAFGSDAGVNSPMIGQIVRDSDVPRFRKRYIISEQTEMGQPIAYDRAVWEMNRRKGRSFAVTVTADAWRDSAGTLWAPNHQAPITLPALKVDPGKHWTIGQVTYLRDETGQHAILVLMPPEAFLPEPMGYMTMPATVGDVEKANSANNPAAKEPTSYQGAAGIQGSAGSPSGPAAR